MNGRTDKWTDERMYGRAYGRMDRQTDIQAGMRVDIMGREAGRLAGKQIDVLTDRMICKQTYQERTDIERNKQTIESTDIETD